MKKVRVGKVEEVKEPSVPDDKLRHKDCAIMKLVIRSTTTALNEESRRDRRAKIIIWCICS